MHDSHLLHDIGIAIIAATALALVARALRQPLILGYLLAGVLVGPLGLSLVQEQASVALISEIGLILLLFIIGLEMDLKKLMGAGKPLVVTGVVQFPVCVAMGTLAARAFGLPLGEGRFDALYAGVALALSSTMIVVKLLYDKFELMTQPGRITLGVLVFQDLWAILALAIQPNLADPKPAILLGSLVRGALLVGASLLLARYALPRLFAFIAKLPELMLVTALAWCFLVAGAAGELGLSKEMGALVAGVALSTFPYNLDVIAKVINIRDFFVTLFFVTLGMQVPKPEPALLAAAVAAALFLVATRFVTVFPALYLLRSGLRGSLLPAINLSQMSEFSLVIAALGLALGHVSAGTVALLTLVFALTSVSSTYMITWNHPLQSALAGVARRLGLRDGGEVHEEDGHGDGAGIVFLGFWRDASSILHEFEDGGPGGGAHPLLKEIQVVDFSPAVLSALKKRGVRAVYGDIASLDTLHHAAVHHAKLVVATITDAVLKGTTNKRLLQAARRLCPEARVVVAADTFATALELYEDGADFVYVPRLHSVHRMAEVIEAGFEEGLDALRAEEIEALKKRDEVLG
jgi:Kef-type K+ transport system membrane component KefB